MNLRVGIFDIKAKYCDVILKIRHILFENKPLFFDLEILLSI